MKKILYMATACLMLSACGNFNEKQPVDANYYKKTQGIAWPEQKATIKKAPTKAQPKVPSATTVSKTITTTTTTSQTTTYTK